MAQDSSIEAARARIQRLVDEIAALSKKEMRSEEYFQQFLIRAVQATDARGGAVWLVAPRADGKSEFQLAAQLEFESTLFHKDEAQHAILLRALSETVREKKPVISPPEPPAPDPSSLEGQMMQMQGGPPATQGANRTAYPFFHIPLLLKEQVLGVLQLWLQPYVKPAAYQEFITFLTSLASHVEQHLHSRRLGTLVVENQRLQHVLKFTGDLAGSLDPLEVSRLSVNYGRDLISCERCSLLTLHGDHWDVLAISGQEVVEKKSSMVKAMAAFVGAHAQPGAFARHESDPRTGAPVVRHESLVLSKKELLARAEAAETTLHEGTPNGGEHYTATHRRTDEIDLAYFEHSHVVSATIAPLFDREKQLVGAYFAESTTEGFFDAAAGAKEPGSAQRLTEWLALHTSKSLEAAHDYRSLPLLAVTKRVRDARVAFTGNRRKRNLLRLVVIGAILFVASFYPKVDQIDGNCVVMPKHRAVVVPEITGLVRRVMVREGDHVKKGQVIAQLDSNRAETEKYAAQQETLRAQAEAQFRQAQGDEAQAQIARLQAAVAQKNVERWEADIASCSLVSPIDGVVLTKDIELRTGEGFQAGGQFAEIAALDDWELQVEVNERKIGRVSLALAQKSPREVNYILYSHSATKLQTELKGMEQVSAVAYPREKEQVFILTFSPIQVPPEVQRTLRPGLTGRGKIVLGREPTLWWLCKRIGEWIRLKWIG